MEIKEVKQRDFVRQFSKYLKEGGVYRVVGKVIYTVSICVGDSKDLSDKASDNPRITSDKQEEYAPKVVKQKIIKTKEDVPKMGVYLRYGCGCERGEGNLCKKHGRV